MGEGRGSSSRGGPTGHAAEGEIHSDSGNAILHSWRQVFLLCAGAFRSGIASTAYRAEQRVEQTLLIPRI